MMHPRIIPVICRRLSNASKATRRKIYLPGRRGSVVLVSVAVGGLLLYYESGNLHRALGVVSKSDVIEWEKIAQRSNYIYLSDLDVDFENSTGGSLPPNSPNRKKKGMERGRLWFSWLQSRSRDPKTLLRLAQSDQHSVRLLGVQALAAQHHWNDAQYLGVAQACDRRTLIGLARSEDVDARFFLDPPQLPGTMEQLEDELRRLLGALPMQDIDKCTQYFTSHAIAEGKIPSEERGGLWCFGGNGLPLAESLSRVPDERVELFCLQALTRHSTDAMWSFDGNGLMHIITNRTQSSSNRDVYLSLHALFTHAKVPSHCPEIVRHNGLQVLQRLHEQRGNSLKICRNIARILANIALHDDQHASIVNAGWVTVLAQWIKSSDLALSMLASKALANLDNDFGGGRYADGIHLYHPQYRFNEPVYADVVFVHGLLGGPFRTWRQRDPEKTPKSMPSVTSPMSKSPDADDKRKFASQGQPGTGTDRGNGQERQKDGGEPEEPRTDCWPKDWLARDYPNMRLLTLEYDTHLTEWAPKCPFESERRSLSVRSAEILRKLKEAGLGRRPIIWVGHSMGGLIIKNVLVMASKDPELQSLVKNSKGIVFYSVPHQGSPLAARSAQARLLLYPSVEVEELSQGSEMLESLHESFREVMFEMGIPLLSFGEGKKSDLPLNFKLMIVPPESSNPGFGEYHLMEDMNHLEICKPQSRQCKLYQLTMEFISDCIPQSLIDHILKANMPEDFVLSDMMK